MASLNPMLMDGAMGSLLISRGLPAGLLPDDLNLTEPEKVVQAHKDYIAAGARVILTNTFNSLQNLDSAEGFRLAMDRLEKGIQIARNASENTAQVLVSLAPPNRAITHQHAKELASTFHGVDGVILETCYRLKDIETLQTLRDSTQHKDLAWGISFALEPGDAGIGQLPDQTSLFEIARKLDKQPVKIVGLNCGKDMTPVLCLNSLKALQDFCQADWLFRPNAGAPTRSSNGWTYGLSPEEFSSQMQPFLQMKINYLGGCCGIHPEHIQALNQSMCRKN